jgi:hypothetical protein
MMILGLATMPSVTRVVGGRIVIRWLNGNAGFETPLDGSR